MKKYAIMLDKPRKRRKKTWPISRESDSLSALERVRSLSTRPFGVSKRKYKYDPVPNTARQYVLVYKDGDREPGSIWELVNG